MKIQCDVCEKAPATLICCADEAALCASCDVDIHAANKLASKHQRLLLECLPNKLPRCDICQEKAAFIFCVEDRALFCRECDEPIHVPGTLSGDHQRYLATGIRVGLTSICNKDFEEGDKSQPPKSNPPVVAEPKFAPPQPAVSPFMPPSWAVDDFLQLSDYESGDKKESPLGFGELDWVSDMGLFQDQQIPNKGSSPLSTAEVPELPGPHSYTCNNNTAFYRPNQKTSSPFKKPRIELSSDDEEFFVVPDLG